MAHGAKLVLLGLLLLAASSATAATVGAMTGKPVAGRPLAVNVPFALDQPADRACASANVHYGSTPVPRVTLHVQGHGLKRNLLVTSRTNVNEQPVRLEVRVGCGARAVTRRFVTVPATLVAAKAPVLPEPPVRRAAPDVPVRSGQKPVGFMTPSEPLFPPPAPAPDPEPALAQAQAQELRKAQDDAATAVAQLAAARKELAAVLDVERRTAQTLIDADHQVRDAQSEAARMRLVLKGIAAALALGAAAVGWFEFQRVTARRRAMYEQPRQEPTEAIQPV